MIKMNRNVGNITEKLKRSYTVKHCIILVFFVLCTIDGAHASVQLRKNEKKIGKWKATRERTLKFLEVENAQSDLCKNFTHNFNSQTREETNHIMIDITKYKDMGKDILGFDDSIKYDSVIIYDNPESTYTSSRISHNWCIRFIEAFGNLQAKRLIISNIYSYDEESSKILPKEFFEEYVSNNILDVGEIVFIDVCKRFALKVLGMFEFKHPVSIFFKDTASFRNSPSYSYENTYMLHKNRSTVKRIVFHDIEVKTSRNVLWFFRYIRSFELTYNFTDTTLPKYCWSDLELLAEMSLSHKLISMPSMEIEHFTNLTETQKENLKEILPVLYIECQRNMKRCDLCSELKDIVKKSRFFYDGITPQEYITRKKEFELLHSSSLSKYLKIDACSLESSFKDMANPSNEDVTFIDNAKDLSSSYNYIQSRNNLFEVQFMVNWEVLTFADIKRMLEWAAEHVYNATSIVFLYKGKLSKDVSVFKKMRIEVQDMQHLETIVLRHQQALSFKDDIIIRDMNCKEKVVRTMTTLNDGEKYTIGLPLSLYVYGSVKNQNKTYRIGYRPWENKNVLIICEKCNLKVYNFQEGKKEPNSTDEILSLEEIKSMTWEEFSESKNHRAIEKHMRSAYDKNRNISLTEHNFTEILKYVLEKPIIVLPTCLHTICAACLYEKRQTRRGVKCSSCKQFQDLSFFRCFVRQQDTNNIDKTYLYSAQVYSKDQEAHYMLYKCAPFQTSKYYSEGIQELTRPNIIIRDNDLAI